MLVETARKALIKINEVDLEVDGPIELLKKSVEGRMFISALSGQVIISQAMLSCKKMTPIPARLLANITFDCLKYRTKKITLPFHINLKDYGQKDIAVSDSVARLVELGYFQLVNDNSGMTRFQVIKPHPVLKNIWKAYDNYGYFNRDIKNDVMEVAKDVTNIKEGI